MPGRANRRSVTAIFAAIGLTAVLTAPLATSTGNTASAATISGARTLTDKVSVTFHHPGKKTRTTDVHLLAFNDLHGTLEAAGNNIYSQFAGGAAFLAKAIKDRQQMYRGHEATVFAGDNIGASPLANGLFFEEPITIATNLMNVDFASVGNHEFDKGKDELLRIQNGGCKPVVGCTAAPYVKGRHTTNRYPGADFQYLSANVTVDATGRTLFPAFGIKEFRSDSGKKFGIGFIGEVLKDTPTIVTPTGVAGLTFSDEADAANKAVKQLRHKGVKTSVLVIHQGGFQNAPAALNGCAGNLAGSDIVKIAERLDPSIKVIVSAHTHAEYRCTITTTDGTTRLITSAASFGRILSDLTLTINDKSGELVSAAATNIVVGNALNAPGTGVVRQPDPSKEDPRVAAVVQQYVTASAPLANQVIGKIQGDLTRTASTGGMPVVTLGESALGDVIADAQLASTTAADVGGAQIAFMNPGGIRGDLLRNAISSGGEAVGEVTYGEAFTVQPFGNSLVTKTMTGDMIRRVLQQQFPGCAVPTAARILQISTTFSYEQAPAAATCEGKIGRMWVNDTLVNPGDTFRVTMNNFLPPAATVSRFNDVWMLLWRARHRQLRRLFRRCGTGLIAVPPLDRIVAVP
jgi:5'-nucleotidase